MVLWNSEEHISAAYCFSRMISGIFGYLPEFFRSFCSETGDSAPTLPHGKLSHVCFRVPYFTKLRSFATMTTHAPAYVTIYMHIYNDTYIIGLFEMRPQMGERTRHNLQSQGFCQETDHMVASL